MFRTAEAKMKKLRNLLREENFGDNKVEVEGCCHFKLTSQDLTSFDGIMEKYGIILENLYRRLIKLFLPCSSFYFLFPCYDRDNPGDILVIS